MSIISRFCHLCQRYADIWTILCHLVEIFPNGIILFPPTDLIVICLPSTLAAQKAKVCDMSWKALSTSSPWKHGRLSNVTPDLLFRVIWCDLVFFWLTTSLKKNARRKKNTKYENPRDQKWRKLFLSQFGCPLPTCSHASPRSRPHRWRGWCDLPGQDAEVSGGRIEKGRWLEVRDPRTLRKMLDFFNPEM